MIEIRQKLRPFSHLPGIQCLIPKSPYVVQVFPALLKILDIHGKEIRKIPFEIQGPLKEFTVFQDLERGCVSLFSEKYRHHILPDLSFVTGKNPNVETPSNKEVLSLGMHKKQEWEGIKKRLDFKEIFPIWFRLGSLLNLPPFPGSKKGMFSLLADIEQVIELHHPEAILPLFEKLFLAGFKGLMVPRLQDDDFQGIVPFDQSFSEDLSPLYLLQEGSHLIRSLFFKSKENEIAILPNLPPEFFAGRMLHLNCSPYGEINMEWTKKTIRQVHFKACMDGNIHFHFQSHLKNFRLRSAKQDKGIFMKCGEPLEIKSGKVYLLDQFQK